MSEARHAYSIFVSLARKMCNGPEQAWIAGQNLARIVLLSILTIDELKKGDFGFHAPSGESKGPLNSLNQLERALVITLKNQGLR